MYSTKLLESCGNKVKILIFSDSHMYTQRMINAITNNKDVNYIIHLGDNQRDTEDIFANFQFIPVCSVLGNCDAFISGKYEKFIDYSGKKFFITHGHTRNVNCSLTQLYNEAKRLKADIALFGHTHIPYYEIKDKIILFNPGSISNPRSGSAYSYGVIEINGSELKVEHKTEI